MAGQTPSPPGMRFKRAGRGHTRVYVHDARPWYSDGRGRWILLGELRRDPERLQTPWRAFPIDGSEFPQRFRVHSEGMAYLKDRWIAAGRPAKPGVKPPPERRWNSKLHQWARQPKPDPLPDPEDWVAFLGVDPFA